jgi:hypothetical protein
VKDPCECCNARSWRPWLTHVRVEKVSRQAQYTVWAMREDLLAQLHDRGGARFCTMCLVRISQVCYQLPFRSPSVFKCYQTGVRAFRAAEIELHEATFFRIPDQIPEEKLHAAEIMRMSIRAAVLVNHFLLMRHGEN